MNRPKTISILHHSSLIATSGLSHCNQLTSLRIKKMLGSFKAAHLIVFYVLCFSETIEAQTSPPVSTPCSLKSNSNCAECLKNVTCLWCMTTKKCVEYPVRTVLPPRSVCPLSDARWGLCWMNFQALIITISVIVGLIIVSILVGCFCYKCERFGRRKKEDAREEEEAEREASARKARQEERKTEMQMRHDEIRQKYGLAKENPYSRFEDN
ncbi:pituitary tumor-transforming gene 1 protein-interacting protein-like isoform X2 [Hypomesus transpacificus]|uniref:pituitary tumor-transforming gene 1 protein-interacting protein-like isoform X2 n=1 Tax=Hypomesus transpacificus TaxID=137520 RepID=UPI001F0815E5|nr:pituitary tumor-transforming gene 1 protein-interacting protein-like isoform X2 [Hypomesus transpacificus]